MKTRRKSKGLSPRGALSSANRVLPDVVAMISEEYPDVDRRLKHVILLRCYGFTVCEIAQYLKTYRNAVYRLLWKAQEQL